MRICQFCYENEATNENDLCDQCNEPSFWDYMGWPLITCFAFFGAVAAIFFMSWAYTTPGGI